MSFQQFRSSLGVGARSNFFRVESLGPIPTSFLVKAASMPGKTIGQIDVAVLGRQLRLPGDVTYDSWSATILNDEGFTVRNALESWVEQLADGQLIDGDITVQQLGRDGRTVLKTITLQGAFPTNLGAMDVSYDSSDTISEFTCDFAYQRWVQGR